MTNELNNYRTALAKKIISTPKQDRRDLLNQEQADEQYWQARQ